MSTPYPSLLKLRTSTTDRASGHEPQRATNGTLKVRRMNTTEKTEFRVEHLLNAAQMATLEAFYQANKDLNVELIGTEDGLTYITRFVAPPQYRRQGGGAHWVASVRLSEV